MTVPVKKSHEATPLLTYYLFQNLRYNFYVNTKLEYRELAYFLTILSFADDSREVCSKVAWCQIQKQNWVQR